MKTIGSVGLAKRFFSFLVILMALCFCLSVHAQLVADGQTVVLDGIGTNIDDTVTVGTNGSFTLLIVTNGAVVTNSGAVRIGSSGLAANNHIAVTGAGSAWYNSGSSFNIGFLGSLSKLDILDGGTVTNIYSYLGFQNPSSNNVAVVSGPGSLLQSSFVYLGQSGGANNQLIITNGGQVVSTSGTLGSGGGKNNFAIVTGANSVWTNSAGLSIGAYGSNSLFIVTNGGTAFSATPSGLGMLGNSSVSNLAVVTDAGSAWTVVNGQLYIGNFSSGNQLAILNGGKVTDFTGFIGQSSSASNNLVLVDGAGSVWTNFSAVTIGNSGSRNTLIITNGGQVISGGTSMVAGGVTSGSNTVVISGTGSVWNASSVSVGGNSAGGNRLYINDGGSLACLTSFSLGNLGNSNLLTLADAGSSLQCRILRIGSSSSGNQCVVSNGATLAAGNLQPTGVGGTGTRVTITGAGTLWTNAADLQFGVTSNTLAILDGGTVVNNNGYIENGSGSPSGNPTGKPNFAVVAGANSLWNNQGDLHMIMENGQQLLITNGGVVMDDNAYIDDYEGNVFTINGGIQCYVLVSGANSMWTNRSDLYLGYKGWTNLLVVSDFGTVNASNIYIGNVFDGNQMVVSNSGTVIARGDLQIGHLNSKSNSVIISGSTVAVTNHLSLNLYAKLILNSGLLRAGFLDISAVGNQFTFNSGTLQLGGSHRFDFNPLVVGNGTSAATLEMINNGSHVLPGGITVNAHAVLKGAGIVTGNIILYDFGTLAPGTTNFGTIVNVGDLVLDLGSTNVMKVDASSGLCDSVIGITNLHYAGTLQLTNIAGSFSAGNAFKLFGATNYFGRFGKIVPASPGAGLRWETNGLAIDGVLRVVPTPTPAPTIGSVMTAGGNLVVSAAGGIPYNPCYLLTCTNFPPAAADWSCVATNYFDASGAASFTNAIPTRELRRYFRLEVN